MKAISIILTIITTIQSFGTTIPVCDTCVVSTIKEAIDLAIPGDTILIKPGKYYEGNIIVDKRLVLLGEGYPILDGQGKTEIITVKSDSVVISGLQLQNVGTSYTQDRAGISVERQSYCIIENNRLFNTFFGIYLKHSSHCVIRNNDIFGEAEQEISSGNAIQLWYSKYIKVIDNKVKNHRDGIYLEFVDKSDITGNVSEDNLRYGLHFMFSNENNYLNNVFKNNGAGVAVMFSREINMIGNIFEDNWGTASYGLLLKEIYDGEISDNIFEDNTIALYGEGAVRLKITNNDFINNGWALKILGSSMDNIFTQNNFIANTFDLSTSSKRNYNKYYLNYWSEYTGYDLDRDGVGDVPFRPVKLFSYLVTKVDPSIILLRSTFIDILNFAEKVTPLFTPETLMDESPLMYPVK